MPCLWFFPALSLAQQHIQGSLAVPLPETACKPWSWAAGSHLHRGTEAFPPSTALHSLHGFNLPREPKTRTPHSSHTTLGNDYLGNESCCTEVSYSVLLRVWLQDTRLALTLERESAHPLTNINSVVCKEFPNPCLSIISAHTHLSHKIDISVRQQNTL